MGNCNIIDEGTQNEVDARASVKEIKKKAALEEVDEKFRDMPEM